MASDFFSKLGSTLRTTAGIGVGGLKLEVDNHDLRMGEQVTGTVTLELEEDTRAERLLVTLQARRKVMRLSRDSRGGRTTTREWQTVYKLERELDGERSYKKGSERHRFDLRIPEEIDETPDVAGGGFVSDVVKVASAIRSATRGPVEWRVIGLLHIPWKRNVKKTIDISVRGTD